jgi:hypothetical protein
MSLSPDQVEISYKLVTFNPYITFDKNLINNIIIARAHLGLLNGLGFVALGGDDSGLKLSQSSSESVASQSADLEMIEPEDYVSIGPHSSSSSWSTESEGEQSQGKN